MPFHFFGPPPPHLLPIALSSALAFAAGAYYVAKSGVPAGVAEFGSRLKNRAQMWRDAIGENRSASMMFSRARNQTGNAAFDDYRAATLRRLEEEADEFRAYLNGLRHAKDKTEFDAFLNERRQISVIPTRD